MKFLKNFSDNYIDLIKVTFYQTLLVGILLQYEINYFYWFAIVGIFYGLCAVLKKWCYIPILGVLLLFSLALNYTRSDIADNHYYNVLSGKDGYGEFVVETDDILYVTSDLVGNSKFVTCEIKNLQLNYHENSFDTTGKILIYCGDLGNIPLKIGNKLKVIGNISFVRELSSFDALQHQFMSNSINESSYKKYLNDRGIYAVIYPDKKEADKVCYENGNFSLSRLIASCRDFLVDKTLRYIKDYEVRNTVAALFYGCKGALDSGWKSDFVKSGTIHLFAVSGMHVGVLYLFLIFLCRYVSFRRRHLLTIIPILIFTVATGANIPAMRAFIMILCFVICKASLLKISNINIILLSATILIGYNADNLTDIGFLYSFVITGVLLLLSDKLQYFHPILFSKRDFVPEKLRYIPKIEKFLWQIIFIMSGCIFAFAAGSMISLLFFGNTYLISLLINGILMLLMTGVSVLMLFSSLISFLGWENNFFTIIFEKVMRGFLDLCHWASMVESNLPIGQVALWEILLFYTGLFTVLIGRKGRTILIGCACILAFLILLIVSPDEKKSGVLVMKNAENNITFCLYESGIDYAILYNIENFEDIELLSNYLRNYGIKRFDYIIIEKLNSNSVKTLNSLNKNFYIKNLFVLNQIKRNERKLLSEMLPTLMANLHFRESERGDFMKNCKFFSENDQFQLEYFNNATNFKLKLFYNELTDVVKIVMNDRVFSQQLTQSNLTEIYNYEL